MTVILRSANVDSFCVATGANYDKWEAEGAAIKELEAQVATLERALAEHESIDSRLASRIGRIEAAMIWFEERQDKVKETMDVTLDNMAWEKRMVRVLLEKSALCEECLEKIELPSRPQSSSPPQQSPSAIQPPESAQVGDIKPSGLGHGSAPVNTTFEEPTHPENMAMPRNDSTLAPCTTNATEVVSVEVPLDDAVPKQLAPGHISAEPVSPSGQELAPEPLPLQMPPSPPWQIPNNEPQDEPMPPSPPSPIPDMQPLQLGNLRPASGSPPPNMHLAVGGIVHPTGSFVQGHGHALTPGPSRWSLRLASPAPCLGLSDSAMGVDQ